VTNFSVTTLTLTVPSNPDVTATHDVIWSYDAAT
jgi:hypothetical protein